MDLLFIIKSLIGLILILGILIALFFYSPGEKRKKKKALADKPREDKEYSFDDLSAIIKAKKSSTDELQWALNTILRYYGEIPPKDGIKLHNDFYHFSELIIRLTHHPHTTKDLILNFDRELQKMNPEYAKEINDALTKGIKSRGGNA
ncbi:hypothetical protein [Sulfurimonas sp. C5]|uniref:hypothetical protein n=1 Tax=Sulfurimonas sp. C5 TaxID=3036947 RepID=UPI002456CE00|nr:hypothetical protein [Sulfurimonas sp. C5]MDH4944828.1 hypothetical protein [Sulfurimonas sp. C5]